MPSATTPSFYLPLVDIAPYLQDPDSPAAKQVLDDVRLACKSTGFFQMKGHGVSPTLQKNLFDASKRFFALPANEKLRLDARKNVGFRGYDAMGAQSYELENGQVSDDALRDVKEGFFASADLGLDHPLVINNRFLQGPNVWPHTEMLAYEDFRVPVEEYYAEMLRLSRLVLRLIAATLPYGANIFDDFETDDSIWLLRLLHYPTTPDRGDDKKIQLGSGEHTDFGAITLLMQDEHPGLEVQNYETGEWVGVPPNKEVYVVNMGDMMQTLTGGEYRSSWHRVLNKSPADRYSVVFFFDGNLDYRLRRFDKLDDTEKVPTVEEHVRGRMTSSYSTK